MSTVTTHVLDTALGRPAAGVPVRLVSPAGILGEGVTDADGRVAELGPDDLDPGTYQLVFDIATYAAATDQRCFFPEVTLTFLVTDASHHHVPLLLSPFAYSTYRGS
jgi:5-hydroxyisourate hydrolase